MSYKDIILIAVVIVITWNVQSQWFPTVEREVVTDTVRVDVPYEVEIIKTVETPVRVTEYETVTDTIRSVEVRLDTVYVTTDNDIAEYASTFLTNYTDAHKFLGMSYASGNLFLTTLSPQGESRTHEWEVGSRNYEIGVNLGLRTSQVPVTFDYWVEAGWIQYVDLGVPHLTLAAELRIFGVDLVTRGTLSQRPFVTTGIRYDF